MLRRMENSSLGVEAVDAITGPLMGRPKSGILRVCDIVGLDTVAHVAATSYAGLENDPWREDFLLPAFYKGMLRQQLLGAKVNAGFYRKGEAGIEALDFSNLAYRPLQKVDLGGLEEACESPRRKGAYSPCGRTAANWASKGDCIYLMCWLMLPSTPRRWRTISPRSTRRCDGGSTGISGHLRFGTSSASRRSRGFCSNNV